MTQVIPFDDRYFSDLVRLFDAYRCFYKQPSDVGAAREFLQNRRERKESVVFLALDQGSVVGFTQLYPCFSSVGMSHIWILNDLFVEGTARGRGIGRKLIDHVLSYAAQTGAAKVVLETGVENKGAQA